MMVSRRGRQHHIGRPKGERRSCLQWKEDNIAPQVVFEIASPCNTRKELEGDKLRFYQKVIGHGAFRSGGTPYRNLKSKI